MVSSRARRVKIGASPLSGAEDAAQGMTVADGDRPGGDGGQRRVAGQQNDGGGDLLRPADPGSTVAAPISFGSMPATFHAATARSDATPPKVRANAVGSPFGRGHLGEHLQRRLRGRFVRPAPHAVHTGIGGDVDDRPRPLRQEMGRRGLGRGSGPGRAARKRRTRARLLARRQGPVRRGRRFGPGDETTMTRGSRPACCGDQRPGRVAPVCSWESTGGSAPSEYGSAEVQWRSFWRCDRLETRRQAVETDPFGSMNMTLMESWSRLLRVRRWRVR